MQNPKKKIDKNLLKSSIILRKTFNDNEISAQDKSFNIFDSPVN